MIGKTAPDIDKVFWAGNIDQLPDPVRSTRWRFIVDQDIFQAMSHLTLLSWVFYILHPYLCLSMQCPY